MEIKLEGRKLQVMIATSGGHVSAVNGLLEAWDPDLKVLVIQEMGDNGVLTDRRIVVNWDKVLWFSFVGPLVVTEVKQ